VKAILAILALGLVAAYLVSHPEDSEAIGGRGTGSAGAGGLGARCEVFADQPTLARDGTVSATGRFQCRKANGSVDTTVYLQLDDGAGHWTNVDRQPMAAAGADATRKRPARDRLVRAAAACVPGNYRTFVRGTVGNDDKGFPVEAVSKPTPVVCADPSPA
jgi:hypothetical protein